MKKEGLSKKERLSLNRDFKRVLEEGKKIWVDKYLLIIYCPNNLTYRRVGTIVSSKVGRAVERNKVKRILRTLFRKNKDLFPERADIIMIPHPRIKNLSYDELQKLIKLTLGSSTPSKSYDQGLSS